MERTEQTDIEMMKLLMDIFESASKDTDKKTSTKTPSRRGRPKGSRNKTTINKLFDINYVLAHLK